MLVNFDRDDASSYAGQSLGARTQARPDLEHIGGGVQFRCPDNCAGNPLVVQKRL